MTKTTFDQPEPDDRGPFDAEAWEALGISPEAGLTWWKYRIDPGDALRWQRAGVAEPLDAVRWKIAAVGPQTVREWVYAEIDAREAVAWTELGFTVDQARKHKRAGRSPVQAYGRARRVSVATSSASTAHAQPRRGGGPHPRRFIQTIGNRDPRVMHSYMQRQWFDDEAVAWATHDIEAADALAWKELGVTPAEARRQQAEGRSAMQVAKAWWQSGIPFDEVADWIGAGLTPKEAAEQRANGVTVERAAVLRSLRKHK